ncbi:MAG: 50S ribosomal protein L21 [Fimbriimonadaceae bacterium]|nr:50S ribosomal protein L21 [Alphaproteobacteria bacterium]
MYAVIKTGGKQYRVAADEIIKIEKLAGEAGEQVAFEDVLLVGNGDDVTVGTPLVDGATVAGEIVEQARNKKIHIFKKKRRKHYQRTAGHRQHVTLVKVTEILTDGKKPSKKTKAAPAGEDKTKADKPKTDKKTAAKAGTKAASTDIKDDIALIGGVGPALKKKLADAKVNSLKDIAAWSKDDVARIDDELKLGGRIERDEWVEQAKELLAGKPPRAKVDQDSAKKDK